MTDTNIDDKPFTVQAGIRYNRRDGNVSGVLEVSPSGMIYIYVDGGGLSWASNGREWISREGPADLISEYKEPSEKLEGGTIQQQYRKYVEENPTAEPQDEWGPWKYITNEDYEVPDIFEGIETVYRDGKIRKWRLRLGPEVTKRMVWIDVLGCVYLSRTSALSRQCSQDPRAAIITLTDGEPSIRWADE